MMGSDQSCVPASNPSITHKERHSCPAPEHHNFLDFMSDAYEKDNGSAVVEKSDMSEACGAAAVSDGVIGRVAAALTDMCDMEDTCRAASSADPAADEVSDGQGEGLLLSSLHLALATAAQMCEQQREMMEHSAPSSVSPSADGDGEDGGEEREGWAAELTAAQLEPASPTKAASDGDGFLSHCWATAADLLTGADYLYDSS